MTSRALAVLGLIAGLALGLVGPAGLATPATAAPSGTAEAAVQCLSAYHARPTGTGWYTDPCFNSVMTEPYGAGIWGLGGSVDFYWTGGRITGARGLGECEGSSPNIYNRCRVTEVRLGRSEPFTGVLTSATADTAWAQYAVRATPTVSGVGCGSTDGRRIGTGSYSLALRTYAQPMSVGGISQPAETVLIEPTYFMFSADGSC